MTKMALVFLLCLLAGPLSAQAWEGRTADNGAYVYGLAQPEGIGFRLMCTVPSLGGVPPLDVEAHEDPQTAPFEVRLEIDPALMAATGTGRRSDVVIWADQTGYRLPTMIYQELGEYWSVDLSMTDALIVALPDADRIVLAPGQDQPWSIPVGDVSAAMKTAFDACNQAAVAKGHRPPPGLLTVPQAPTSTAPEPPTLARARAHVVQGCGGSYRDLEGAFGLVNIDGDGVPDTVVDWGVLRCESGLPRPFCGASHCSVDVFLSASPKTQNLLGIGMSVVPLTNGLQGIAVGGGLGSCGGTSCQFVFYWDGQTMQSFRQNGG